MEHEGNFEIFRFNFAADFSFVLPCVSFASKRVVECYRNLKETILDRTSRGIQLVFKYCEIVIEIARKDTGALFMYY